VNGVINENEDMILKTKFIKVGATKNQIIFFTPLEIISKFSQCGH
tara:strand:+ start:1043 stop:1177 length:135 start_codon:yes stop_codon:yes gene_type:complete